MVPSLSSHSLRNRRMSAFTAANSTPACATANCRNWGWLSPSFARLYCCCVCASSSSSAASEVDADCELSLGFCCCLLMALFDVAFRCARPAAYFCCSRQMPPPHRTIGLSAMGQWSSTAMLFIPSPDDDDFVEHPESNNPMVKYA